MYVIYIMTRTQIYIEDDQKEALETLAKSRGVAMADLIREGIDAILSASRTSAMAKSIEDLAGMWSDREDIPDGVSYEDSIRRGWSQRPVLAEKSPTYGVRKKKRR